MGFRVCSIARAVPAPLQAAMADLRSQVESVVRALEGEKEKADNLHGSFVEVMELKQNEVSHLLTGMGRGHNLTFASQSYIPLSSPITFRSPPPFLTLLLPIYVL